VLVNRGRSASYGYPRWRPAPEAFAVEPVEKGADGKPVFLKQTKRFSRIGYESFPLCSSLDIPQVLGADCTKHALYTVSAEAIPDRSTSLRSVIEKAPNPNIDGKRWMGKAARRALDKGA
jgi:hypothetical protein